MSEPSKSTKVDVVLEVDRIDPEELSQVWEVLSRVAQGLGLDGFDVGVRIFQWDDGGDEDEFVIYEVDDEGTEGSE